ncbi:MAG TPA: hypothetical protein VK968_14565, partial [Roseimicrobium sp.]|nr:hypothetical protein [Roseimicrobium sp.]
VQNLTGFRHKKSGWMISPPVDQDDSISVSHSTGHTLPLASALAVPTPFAAVLDDPVGKRAFEADVVSRLLGLDPLVTQNLLPLRLELPVEGRVLEKIARLATVCRLIGHVSDQVDCFDAAKM